MIRILQGSAIDRRGLFGRVAAMVAAAQLGRSGDSRGATIESASLPAVTSGAHTSLSSLRQIDAGLLTVSYAEAGPVAGPPVILLHGWRAGRAWPARRGPA